LVAIVLAVASATLPLVVDQCAASCVMHTATSDASTPSCHHETATTPHVGGLPSPCGHDHHAPASTLTTPASPSPRTLLSHLAVAVAPALANVFAPAWIGVESSSSPPASHARTFTLPLRI
jgi:hypothetical protein